MKNKPSIVPVVRVLEWAEDDGLDIMGRVELKFITIKDLEKLFGFQENDPYYYDVYGVEPEHVEYLQRFTGHVIDLDKYVYQVACFAA